MVSNPILVNVYALCVHMYWLGPHTYYKQWVMSCDWLVLFSACRWCCDWSVLAAIAGGHSWCPGVACATISGTSGWGGFWHLIKYVFILNKFIYIIDILKVSQSEILVIFIYLYMNVLGRVHDTVDVIPVNYKITHWYANIYNHNKNNLTQVNRGLV